MDDKAFNNVGGAENGQKSPSSSESSEYELVDQDPGNPPPIVSNNVSEDLINDAIGSSELNSPTTAANMMVGKSIFYDCNDKTNSDSDEGFYFFLLQSFVISTLFYFRRCTDL
jgi:hypothetical protein